jgi:hypothetical protein
MRLQRHGKSTSEVEVTNISNHGIWLFVKESEYFLPFEEYPWFKKAKVKEIYNLKLLQEHHLYWPDLDVDLELESLERPNEYPLIFKN